MEGWEWLQKVTLLTWTGADQASETHREMAVGGDAQFGHGTSKEVLRGLHQLPEMPRVKKLYLPNVSSLERIERFPKVRRLELGGLLTSVAPLAVCRELEQLRIESSARRPVNIRHLEVLAKLAKLCYVEIKRRGENRKSKER